MRSTFIIFLLLAGCQSVIPEKETINKYFDLPSFTRDLISVQAKVSSPVTKIMGVNGVGETILIDHPDSLFWANELSPMLSGTINKPSLVDAYLVEENVPDEFSNLLKTTYTAKPETNTIIKKLEIKFLKSIDEIRQVHAFVDNQNLIYSTQLEVHLWVNRREKSLLVDSIITSGFNKTIFLDSMKYKTAVKTN